MLYETINFQKMNHVMVIYFIQPDSHVKMVRLSEELTEVCAEVDYDEEIRVIVLTGIDEKSFVIETGFDGKASRGYGAPQARFCSIAEPIAKLNHPVIAAINGNAMGQGLELALACDMRIAPETSHFGLPHIQAGVIPWDGGTQRLSRLVGRGKALEMVMTGEMIDAQEAFRIGLVHKVVSKEELMEAAMDLAKEMAAKGPIALRYAKEAIYKGMEMTLEQGLRLEADLYLLIHTTKDRTEGIKAFREKKAPRFEGR